MASNPSAFTTTPASIGAAPAAAVAWQPSDNALLGAMGDPWNASNSIVPVAGTLYLTKLPVRAATTFTTLWWLLEAVGVGASSGSFGGLYSSAGTLLSGSADIGAALTAVGPLPVTLTTPQAVPAGGFVWAGLLTNLATTQPAMGRALGVNGSLANLGLVAATLRFATNGSGQTVLPASITPGSNAVSANTYWAGWS